MPADLKVRKAMNDYEKWLNNQIEEIQNDLYGRIEEMLNVCRKYVSHDIMMELLDVAYPSASREVEKHNNS